MNKIYDDRSYYDLVDHFYQDKIEEDKQQLRKTLKDREGEEKQDD